MVDCLLYLDCRSYIWDGKQNQELLLDLCLFHLEVVPWKGHFGLCELYGILVVTKFL